MEEAKLRYLLQSLPHERARSGFTARVLRRLDAEPESRAARHYEVTELRRLMLATVTVAVVGLSIALLPREHTPLPLSVSLPPAGERLAVALRPQPARRLSPSPLGIQPAMSRPLAGLDAVEAHQMVQELRQESSRLERELHSLRQPVSRRQSPPAVVYLGGDENVDLVMSTGHVRAAQVMPPADRDDGELNNFLD